MNLISLAWRNILRNRRRSALTLAAIAVAATAMLILGGYVKATVRALETDTVRHVGHLQVMSRGYLQFGRANPARFAMRDYEDTVAALQADPELASLMVLATPVLYAQGVAGNFASGTSSNFSGNGWDPDARRLMLEWDGNGLRLPPGAGHLSSERLHAGVIGVGLAQLLGLCEALSVQDCTALPKQVANQDAPPISDDLNRLARQSASDATADRAISVELLSAGSGGAPNVVRMEVLRTQRQGARDLDAMYVGMPLSLAQRLIFGPDSKGVSAIVVQLKQSADLERARRRIDTLLAARNAALEVHDFHAIQPNFDQVVGMFNAVFRFVAILMALVTLFSVANTVNMAVGERIGEIGTLRAIGQKRRHVRSMFLIEGAMIGVIGAALGVVLSIFLGEYLINHSGLSWTPPGRSSSVPIGVDMFGSPGLMAASIAVFAVLACVSSWWPARRASTLQIVEALRHV